MLNFLEIQFRVEQMLEAYGLRVFGWFPVEQHEEPVARSGLLIGNVGGSHWEVFSSSSFFSDDQPDPMNRWTQSVLQPISDELGAEVCFPFGDRVWPFQRWAMEAGEFSQSPLGLLIHSRYGLWTAFRGALIFDVSAGLPVGQKAVSPCNTCADKPCLNSCPVSAFSTNRYAVSECRTHVASHEGRACLECGCWARRACPVGQEFMYEDAQQAFHMTHFV